MSDLGDWFRSIPLITRYWFAASIAVPLLGKLGLINPVYLILWPEYFLYKFQIWRPFTSTFYFPVGPGTGFLYMVNLYFLYQYSTRLETGAFDGRPADYMFMLLFNWICIVITGVIMDMQLLMIPLIMSVLYVWSQLNRDMIVSFWFGTRFKACYLPWVILGFNYIIGGSIINELIGNLVGHLYFFLMFKYPMDLGGRSFLSTPEILILKIREHFFFYFQVPLVPKQKRRSLRIRCPSCQCQTSSRRSGRRRWWATQLGSRVSAG
ncbi:derlin-1 isoform X1 [Aquarana catesbeiana]|uniref:derlin-1 isoform X1 n=1 Tax=Aquarana catesbeiana TaxID=8400 RepID=UPI003CC9BE39